MDYANMISYIEDESVVLTSNFYYHTFQYKQEILKDMVMLQGS